MSSAVHLDLDYPHLFLDHLAWAEYYFFFNPTSVFHAKPSRVTLSKSTIWRHLFVWPLITKAPSFELRVCSFQQFRWHVTLCDFCMENVQAPIPLNRLLQTKLNDAEKKMHLFLTIFWKCNISIPSNVVKVLSDECSIRTRFEKNEWQRKSFNSLKLNEYCVPLKRWS